MASPETIKEYQLLHDLQAETKRWGDEFAQLMMAHFDTSAIDWQTVAGLSGWSSFELKSISLKCGRKGRGAVESLPVLEFVSDHGRQRIVLRCKSELKFYGFDQYDEESKTWLRLPMKQAASNLKEIVKKIGVVNGNW